MYASKLERKGRARDAEKLHTHNIHLARRKMEQTGLIILIVCEKWRRKEMKSTTHDAPRLTTDTLRKPGELTYHQVLIVYQSNVSKVIV